MSSFMHLESILKGRDSRKVGNNTYVHRSYGGGIAVRLHSTDVVTYYPDGECILNSGGWETVTTADRINRYLPSEFNLSSWHVYKGSRWGTTPGECVQFRSGMDLSKWDTLLTAQREVNALNAIEHAATVKANRSEGARKGALKRKMTRLYPWADEYAEELTQAYHAMIMRGAERADELNAEVGKLMGWATWRKFPGATLIKAAWEALYSPTGKLNEANQRAADEAFAAEEAAIAERAMARIGLMS